MPQIFGTLLNVLFSGDFRVDDFANGGAADAVSLCDLAQALSAVAISKDRLEVEFNRPATDVVALETGAPLWPRSDDGRCPLRPIRCRLDLSVGSYRPVGQIAQRSVRGASHRGLSCQHVRRRSRSALTVDDGAWTQASGHRGLLCARGTASGPFLCSTSSPIRLFSLFRRCHGQRMVRRHGCRLHGGGSFIISDWTISLFLRFFSISHRKGFAKLLGRIYSVRDRHHGGEFRAKASGECDSRRARDELEAKVQERTAELGDRTARSRRASGNCAC